jgi:26S proteasome non-ATPase regulatory subunit 10
MLLQAGAPASASDCTGSQPLHRAAGTGRLDLVKLLVEEAGAGIDVRDGSGASPLLVAAVGGHAACAVYLASKGADVEAEDGEGQTPLGAAAVHGGLREALVAVVTGEREVEGGVVGAM